MYQDLRRCFLPRLKSGTSAPRALLKKRQRSIAFVLKRRRQRISEAKFWEIVHNF